MKTVEEVMQTVLQDKVFYEESNGGLTLSGGEILAQPDFAIALLKEAHRHHLHTCCETTGYATKEVFCSVAEHVDFIYMDMKHWDEKKHREGTGVSNVPILENMKLAVEMHKEILPRIPVIPGYNDSLEDAVQFSKTLKKTGILKCQLLPFHQFGENKYSLLGKDYAYRDIPAYHPEDLETYRQTFTDNGIEAFF